MKTSKRLLSLLLAVVMVVTTCSVGMSAFAADKSDDVFTYVTDEGKAVDITYESLNNLVNTYAPEIIKLINKDGKLTDLGVDVDAVCASEKPIYELLAQLSPTLIQLMSGSNGDSDEVIKAVLWMPAQFARIWQTKIRKEQCALFMRNILILPTMTLQ